MSAQPYDLSLSAFKQDIENYLSALEKTRKQYLDELATKQTISAQNETLSKQANALNETLSNDIKAVWSDVAVLDYYSQRYRQIKKIITLLDDPSKHAAWPRLARFLKQNTYRAILREESIQNILTNDNKTTYDKLEALRKEFAGQQFQSQLKRIQRRQSIDRAFMLLAMAVSAAAFIAGMLLLTHLVGIILFAVSLSALFAIYMVTTPAFPFKKNLKQEVKALADAFNEDNKDTSSFSLSNKEYHYKINQELKVVITAPDDLPKETLTSVLKTRFSHAEKSRFFSHDSDEETSIQNDVDKQYSGLLKIK